MPNTKTIYFSLNQTPSKKENVCVLCGLTVSSYNYLSGSWPVDICYTCITDSWWSGKVKKLIDAAFEAGRKSVIGDLSDADDADGESSKVITK